MTMNNWLMRLSAVTLTLPMGLAGSCLAADLPLMAATPEKAAPAQAAQLMFVQIADDFKAEGQTLRLVNADRQSIYFADRPVRQAGHLSMVEYLKEWTAAAGANNFASDPPNATLSVYEGDRDQNTLTVIEISDPKLIGRDLVYRYKLIEGTMPKTGGATALFIDWIGVGGGVGPGFHGVGVGRRGVGLR